MGEYLKQPPSRRENGITVYTVTNTVPSGLYRPVGRTSQENEKEIVAPGADGQRKNETAETAVDGPESAPQETEPGLFVSRFRLISGHLIWSSMFGLGPQCHDYGHNDSAVIRQIPSWVTQYGVPVARNHAIDVESIVGDLRNPSWEDSTDIPPGVNADVAIAEDVDPKLYNALRHGFLKAGSIEFSLDCVLSHPDLEFEEFAELAGVPYRPVEIDGRTVAWNPVNLNWVRHYALVQAGADIYARERTGKGQEQKIWAGADLEQEAAKNMSPDGAGGVMEQAYEALGAWAQALGITVSLSPGSELPETLNDRALGIINKLLEAQSLVNRLTAELESWAPALLLSDEQTLTIEEIVRRVPERLAKAKNGDEFIEDLKKEALRLFDAAKTDPELKELSDDAKALRGIIEACKEIDQLKAWQAEYRSQVDKRFGPVGDAHRSSVGEELPQEPNNKAQIRRIGRDLDIAEAASRMFEKGRE